MASHNEIARRWAQEVGKESPKMIRSRNGNVYVDWDDRIYSYGSHFEMGRLVGDRETGFFLLNGDRYSPTTAKHQSQVRAAVSGTGIPSVIVPYSALRAAGIDRDSIRPLDIDAERTEETRHKVIVAGLHELAADVASGNRGWTSSGGYGDNPGALSAKGSFRRDGAEYSVTAYKRGYSYTESAWTEYDPPQVHFYRNGSGLRPIEGDTFEYSTWRHFLGACLFTAKVAGRKSRAKFLSAFDENERRPLYFLCELPRCSARTYAEALDALAPRIVHAALAQGRDVKRQGDLFAIPTDLDRKTLRARGARFAKRVPMLDTNHAATETAFVKGAVYARGCLYHDVGSWRDRDHARVKLGDGKTWHLVTRNTVPRARSNRRSGAERL